MYMIDKQVKRHFNAYLGGSTREGNKFKQYVEPVKLIRDEKGRLATVEGWEYIDYNLNYGDDGILNTVDVTHRLTGKHLQITLKYNDKYLLEEVIPEIIEEGDGDPGSMDVPNVIEDY